MSHSQQQLNSFLNGAFHFPPSKGHQVPAPAFPWVVLSSPSCRSSETPLEQCQHLGKSFWRVLCHEPKVQIAPDAEAFLNCPTQHPHDSPKFQLQMERPPAPSCLWDVPGAPVAVALGLVARLLLCADRPRASPPLPRGVTWVRC